MIDAGIEQLQGEEQECLRRFRSKAAELSAADPALSKQIAFARAVQALPKTAEKYQYVPGRGRFRSDG